MKKLPSMRSLYQSAARSERQSKTWKAPGPASSMTRWMASVKLSKPSAGRDPVDLGARRVVEERLVAGEAEVDDAAPLGAGPGHEGQDERRVVLEVLDLPDHVVARPQPLEDVVEGGEAGPGRIDRDHRWVVIGHADHLRPLRGCL